MTLLSYHKSKAEKGGITERKPENMMRYILFLAFVRHLIHDMVGCLIAMTQGCFDCSLQLSQQMAIFKTFLEYL